ncbi:PKD-like domain-containing protein [Bacteroides sp. UBA939]|uniref:PKD-like domain-containing protein n=1 Tax=Bacteroides sp. UBA939 TaxID=1946092 RepID=UPI0025BB6651|nr:PKD-like domain-containing protein [Bacteroides sp. UBA939]
MKQAQQFSFLTCETSRRLFQIPTGVKKWAVSLFVLVLFMHLGIQSVNAQSITLSEITSPGEIVPMGDSVLFEVTVFSSAAMSNAELEVTVPAGFELLTTTPNFKPGSLSPNKLIGRVIIPNVPQTQSVLVKIYARALCDAQTATPVSQRMVKYAFYRDATAPASLASLTSANRLINIFDPVFGARYPASKSIQLGVREKREFMYIQSRQYSHINSFKVNVACNSAGFLIDTVEISRNGSTWTKLPASALTSSPSGYTYIITKDMFAALGGYTGNHLNYDDTIRIRETVMLRTCGQGTVAYSFSYGDGTTFCAPQAGEEVVYSEPLYEYTPDINIATPEVSPTSPDNNGSLHFVFSNNSAQAEAIMYNLYVDIYNGNYTYKKAYVVNAAGVPVLYNGDTVFLTWRSSRYLDFSQFNNSAMASWYASLGMSSMDGDGVYDDLEQGSSFYFKVEYNYIINTGACPNELKTHATRRGDLYYQTFCKDGYRSYTRNYSSGTNTWVGGVAFSSIRGIDITNVNLSAGDQTRLTFSNYYGGNGTIPGVSGTNLIALATTGTAATGNVPTSDFWTIIELPVGLAFDATQTNPLRIGSNTNIPTTSYTVSPDGRTIKIKWTANWNASNYPVSIALKATGTTDTEKKINISHEYDYGKTGTIQKFGCSSTSLGYVQIGTCEGLGLQDFEVERTVFGYTDTTKATRVTDVATAKGLGYNTKVAGPYDNVTLRATAEAGTLIPVGGANRIDFEISYENPANANRAFDLNPDSATNAIRIWHDASATWYVVPASNVTLSKVGTKHKITADLSPALATGLTSLATGDKLTIEVYTRVNTNISTAVSTADVNIEVGITPVFGGIAIPCYNLMDVMTLFNYNWANKTTSSGGTSGYTVPGNWNQNTTTNLPAMDLGINWSYGGTNPFTGGEYRPNGDNFSNVTTEYPYLMHVHLARSTVPGKLLGNMSAGTLDTITDYIVTYSAGKTYVTFLTTQDAMTTASSTGIGYNLQQDVVNYNNPAATMNARISYSYDMYPTSAAPQRYTATSLQASNQSNGGSRYWPYTYVISPLSKNVSPMGSRVEWTLRITNQSNFIATDATLPNSWLAVECPAGVLPVELRNASDNSPIPASFVEYAPNKYWIKIGTVTANPTKDYILSCTYAICTGTPELTVKYGMSKVAYPEDPANGYAQAPYNSPGVLAGVASTQISYTPPTVKFSGNLVHHPNRDNNTNQFCDTISFLGTFTNALESTVSGLTLEIDLPSGFRYYQQVKPRAKFGNAPWSEVESVISSGNHLTILLSSTQELTAYGTPGSVAQVDFTLRVECGLENGIQLATSFIGHSGCGAETRDAISTMRQIRIFGLEPPPDYWINDLYLTQTDFVGGSDSSGMMTLMGEYQLTQPAATEVYAIIDLPKNVQYVRSNGMSLQFTQTGTRLIAPLPSNAQQDDTYPFNLTLMPTNPEQWSMDSTYIYVRTGKLNTLTCDGIQCQLMELGERYDSVTVSMIKLEVEFSEEITAVSRYNDGSSERVTISGWLKNVGEVDAARLAMELYYFDGIDYMPVSNVINGLAINSIPVGDSVAFTINTNVLYTENVCNMVLMLRRASVAPNSMNPYLAYSSELVVPVPSYKLSAVVDPICQMDGNTVIGELPITDYSYVWEPSDYLSRNNTARPYFNYDYENHPIANDTVLKYAISIIRPNQCVSVDTLEVPIKGIPYVQDFEDMTLCSGEALYIEFKDTTNSLGNTTFSWVVENGPSVGLSASGTRSIIDVASVRNNTTQPIILQVRVTPKKNNCEGVTKSFFITVNPAVRINYIVDQTYCNGSQVSSQVLSGNLSSSLYRWEHIGGTTIPGLTSGVNVIPSFLATNATTSPITGNFHAFAEYDNADKKCYSDTINFSIKIEPTPTVNTVGDRHICNGGDLTINFTGVSTEAYYWQKVSGSNIPGLASNGQGNISLTGIANTTTSPISAVYKVTPARASGTCLGIEDNFTITIYPTPALTSTKTPMAICSGETFNYTATSATRDLIYSWTRLANTGLSNAAGLGASAVISESLHNITQSAITVQYEYRLLQETYCPKLDTISVVVNPVPDFVILNAHNTICSGASSSVDLNYVTNNTVANLEYSISYSDIAKANGFVDVVYTSLPVGGSISAILPSNTPAGVYTGLMTVRFGGAPECIKTIEFTITVNPVPDLTNEKNYTICSGEELNVLLTSSEGSSSFSWTRAVNSSINNNASKSGNGSTLKEVLTSSSSTAVTVKYAVTIRSGSCSSVDTVTVTVNPKPVLSNIPSTATICSGNTYTYNTPSSNVSGAVISWERLDASGIDEPGTTGTGSINEVLTNNTTSAVLVTYEFTLQANGCENREVVRITVHPEPVLTSTLFPAAICSGSTFNYTARTATRNVIFSWTRQTLPSGVTGSGSGTGSDARISDVLANTTADPVAVRYDVVMTINGCSNIETVEVIVNPVPKLSSLLDAGEQCSGEYFVYDIQSATQGASFSWRRQNNVNVNEAVTNSGSSLISERLSLKDGVTSTVTVKYMITTEANGCKNTGEELEVDIHPLPTLSVDKTTVNMASGTAATVTATTNGTVVSWSSSNTNVVTVSAGNTVATLTAVSSGTAYVTLKVNNANGCTNEVSIYVNVGAANTAALSLALGYPAQICNGESTDLSLDISGGEVPFTLKYSTTIGGVLQDTTTVSNLQNTSRITVNPVNSGHTVTEAVYSIVSVTDNAGHTISHLPTTVTVQVNPTPAISTTFSTITKCENEMVSIPVFSSNVANASYEWTNSNPSINLSMSGTGNIPMFQVRNGQGVPITATINVRALVRSGNALCYGPAEDFDIIVNPQPTFSVVHPAPICEGESYVFSQGTNTVGVVPSNSTVTFYSDISCTISVTTVSPSQTTTYYAKATSAAPAGCASEVAEVILTVNPKPVLNSLTSSSVCSGERFEYIATTALTGGVSYSWSRAAVTGISNAAGSGNGATIRETLINEGSTAIDVIYKITMTANGCTNTEDVVVTVNPKPVLTTTQTPPGICSGATFTYPPSFNINPLGSYNWSRSDINGIEEPASGADNVEISETLTNIGYNPITVRYSITMESSQGCINTQEVRVEVSPAPALSSTLYPNAICSGSTFSYSARSRTSGVVFSWERLPNANIAEPEPATSQPGNQIVEVLTNNTTSAVDVEYRITMKLPNNCSTSEVVVLTVNPSPTVSSVLTTDTICSGDYFTYQIESGTSGGSYIWKRAKVAGISQQQGFGTIPYISEMLTNTTAIPVEVSYEISVEANGCMTTGIMKKVVVNPSPVVTITESSPMLMNVGGTHTLSPNTTASVIAWESSNSNVVTVNNSGLIEAKSQGTAVVTVTVENAQGCISQASIIVNVGAAPTAILSLVSGASSEVCNGSSTILEVTITGGTAPYTIIYTDDVTLDTDTVTAYASPYRITVTPPANTGDVAADVTYTLNSVTYGPSKTSITPSGSAVITVNPTATITTTLNNITVCEGDILLMVSFTSNIDAARVSYSWTNDNPNVGLSMSGQYLIPSFQAENRVGAPTDANITIIPTYTGIESCAGTPSGYKITVNPKPTFMVVNPPAICEGESYMFSSNDVIGVLPAGSIIKFYTERTCVNEITTAVEPLVTTTYYVRLTSDPEGCHSDVQEITLTVNPLPVLSSQKSVDICSGEELVYTATTALSGVSYVWERAAVAGISNPARSGVNGSNIRETLLDTTATAIEVTYRITMTVNGCSATDSVKVTVNPKPELNNIPTATDRLICSGGSFVYTPNTNVAGTSIRWERMSVNGIAEGSSTGTDIEINEILTNTTANPVVVTYEFTLQAGDCPNVQTVQVTVNPAPELSSALYLDAICSGNTINYRARTQSKNVSFSWERMANLAISQPSGSVTQGAAINEILTNLIEYPTTVYYAVKMSVDGSSCFTTDTLEIVVNPIPALSSTTTIPICSDGAFVHLLESNTEGAEFIWIRQANSSIVEPASTGNTSMISEVLTLRGSTADTVDYTVLTSANGCRNNGETLSVVVNPLPVVYMVSPTPVNLAANASKLVEASTTGTVVSWSSSNVSIVTVTAQTPDTTALLEAKAEGIAHITLEVESANGCRNMISFTVNVDAENLATMSLASGAAAQICNGDNTTLQVDITGGKAPFTVKYEQNGVLQTKTVSSSNGRFQVTPPVNTTDTVQTVTYTLASVEDADGQPITVISSIVNIEVNPTAKITNATSLSTQVCEGAIVSTPKFTSNVTNANRVSYIWFNDNPGIGLAVSGSGHVPTFRATNGNGSPITANITAVATYNGLVSCQDLAQEITFTIVVDPKPDFVVINPEAICAGTAFDLNARSGEIIHDTTPGNVTIEFFSSRSCSPVSKITSAVTPDQTTIYYARLTSDEGCVSDVKEVTVAVNPVPVADDIDDQTLCNNSAVNIQLTGGLQGTIYEWVRVDSETDITGLASSGTNVVYSHRLTNGSDNPKTATIAIIPKYSNNGITCIGDTVYFDITVNPTLLLNVPLLAGGICSGAPIAYDLESNTNGLVYTWERIDNDNIAESPIMAVSDQINETLTNLSQKTVNVRYAVTMELDGCSNMQYVTVPIYPIPELTSNLHVGQICSGDGFVYQGTSAVTGTEISWVRQANTNILETEDPLFQNMPISEILTNKTALPITVKYTVKLLANGCENIQEVELVVGPTLSLTSEDSLGIFCSGEAIVYEAESPSTNIHFSWIRTFNADIDPPQASGNSANINEILYNTSNTRQPIEYIIRMQTNIGCQVEHTVRAEICAVPEISVSESEVLIAAGATRILDIQDNMPANATVSSKDLTIATVSFNVSTLELTVTALKPGITQIVYTTHCEYYCENSLIIPVTVTNGPVATLEMQGVSTVCSEGVTEVQITDIQYGKGPWEVEINYNGGNASSAVTVSINSLMDLPYPVSVTLPENVSNTYAIYNYSVTKVVDSEGSERTNHIGKPAITVIPVPKADAMSNQEICNGSKNNIVYFSGVATNYRWTIDTAIGIDLMGEGIKLPSYELEHNNSTPVTATVSVTPEYTMNYVTCVGIPEQFTITVNPLPSINAINNVVSCHESSISIPLTGTNATEYIYTAAPLVGLSSSGTISSGNSLDFTADNTTSEVITEEITITPVYRGLAKECYGEPVSFRVTVNPKPTVVSTADMEFCTGTKVDAYEFTGSTSDAAYSWKRISGDVITGLPDSGTKRLPAFTAYNTGSSTIVAEYEVLAAITNLGNTCGDKKDTFQITIYPEPVVNYLTEDHIYCSGEATREIVFGDVAITTYEWRQVGGYNIGLSPNYGTDTLPSFVTTNRNSSIQAATFEVYPRIKGTACLGSPITFTIEVKPEAILTSPIDNGSICSGTQFVYEATSTSDNNVYYKWERPAITGVNEDGAKQGQGRIIREILTNTTDSSIIVEYILNLEYDGCQSYDTINLTVNPTPAILLDSMTYNACPSDIDAVLTYTTSNPSLPIEYMLTFDSEARRAGFDNMVSYATLQPGEIFVPMPREIATGRYNGTITIRSYGCSGENAYPFTINVMKQTEIISHPVKEVISCDGGVDLYLEVIATGENLIYQWYKDSVAIAGATSSVYEKQNADRSDYGIYYVVVTGICGEEQSESTKVIANPAYIQRKWDEVLFISNVDTNGVNLQFVSYQWYRVMPTGKTVAIGVRSNKQYYEVIDKTTESTYMVKVFYADGTSIMSCPFTYAPLQKTTFKLYPNPVLSNEILNISMDENDYSGVISIEIFDALGIQLYKGQMETMTMELPMDMKPGAYVIRLTDQNGVVKIGKVIVK